MIYSIDDEVVQVFVIAIAHRSEAEQRDRVHLERRVERAVFEAIKALAQLRVRP